jgi:hypothetical protein
VEAVAWLLTWHADEVPEQTYLFKTKAEAVVQFDGLASKGKHVSLEPLGRLAAAPEPLRVAETPGAQEAFRALDVADRIIERACGVDVAQEWNDVYAAVAEARSVSPTPDQPKPEVKDV